MTDRYEGMDDDRLEQIHNDRAEERIEAALSRWDNSRWAPDLGDKTDDWR